MPSASNRSPKSLYESCLHFWAYHFARCTQNRQKTWTDRVKEEETLVSNCVINPFEKLPSCLLQVITDHLFYKGKISIYNLEWLIIPGAKGLYLSWMQIDSERTVAHFGQLAAACCPELTFLVMDHVETCPLRYYNQFLPQFKNLQELQVTENFERFNDSCLYTLGLYCRHLRILEMTECHVTDNGIVWLCGGPTDPGHEGLMYGQCKSLERLLMDNTSVTLKGVQIALRNLPRLLILEHDQVFEALVDMHKNDAILPKYGLIKLKIRSLCPSLNRLSINEPEGVTDSNLLGLSALESLSELKLSDELFSDLNHYPITFNGGLAPLLKARGSSLTVLKLDLPIAINLETVMGYCPNLERLSLSSCRYSLYTGLDESGMTSRPSKLKKTDFVWEHLKKLKLSDDSDLDEECAIPREVLLFVLSRSPSLKHLEISDCDSLDDDLLQQVFLYHQFISLECLSFSRCNNVTKDGINLFVDELNLLKELSLDNCKLVLKANIIDWRKKAKTNGWDFRVRHE